MDTVEHKFPQIGDDSMMPLLIIRGANVISSAMILCTNLPLILFILKQSSKSFLDKLIVFDCVICIFNTFPLIKFFLSTFEYHKIIVGSSDIWVIICTCHVFFSFFANLCNRLITLGVAFYRYFLIIGSSFLWTTYQRKLFEKSVMFMILFASVNLTGWAIYYRENWKNFLGMYHLKFKLKIHFNIQLIS